MPRKFNREPLKSFLLRRKSNALGLTIITAASALITLCCALTGFNRTDVLAVVTILLILLCLLQAFKFKKSFRTMKSFRGFRKRSHSKNGV